jgi:hypothetical protein
MLVRTAADKIVEAFMLAAVTVLPIVQLVIFEYKQSNSKNEYKTEADFWCEIWSSKFEIIKLI